MINDIIECALAAGEIAMRYFRNRQITNVDNKLNDADIVTTADKESEQYIRKFIAEKYPHHAILAEESGLTQTGSEYRWVIDPIDGTTNFYAGIPFFAISIGVEYKGKTKYGVVYNPATSELFHAVRGEGAYLNHKEIHVSSETRLSRSVICTGFPVDKNVNRDNNLDNFSVILPKVRDMRRLGSAALDICYVGAGYLNGFWELGLHEWDVNAATLIAEEAGAICTRFRENRGVSILVASPSIHDQLLPLLNTSPRK